MRRDPTSLEILGTKAAAAAEEMSYTLQRTGRTLYVKETADFATGLVRKDGLFFAYPRSVGVAFFVALDCGATLRSEEHTSELQSLMRISYAVFCLKKKITCDTKINTTPARI